MLPWSFSEEAAAQKYMPQLQHNMWVVAARGAVLSGRGVDASTKFVLGITLRRCYGPPLLRHILLRC